MQAVIGAVNLAEVVSKFVREQVALDVVQDLDRRPRAATSGRSIESSPMLPRRCMPATRGQGLSLGDRACLALAHRLGATALTTDRAWSRVDVGVAIEVIR